MEELGIEVKVLACIYQQAETQELIKSRRAGIKLAFFLYPHTRIIMEGTLAYVVQYNTIPQDREELISWLEGRHTSLRPTRDTAGIEIPSTDRENTLKLIDRMLTDPDPGTFQFRRDQLRMNWMRHVAMGSLEQSVKFLESGNISDFTATLLSIPREIARETDDMVRIDPIVENADDLQRDIIHRREHPEEHVVIPTGLPWMDDLLAGGFRKGENYLGMGFSGRGKSFLGTQFCYHAAWNMWKVVKFPLEMKARKDIDRHYSRMTGIPHEVFRTPHLMTDKQLAHFQTELKEWQTRECCYHVRSPRHRITVDQIEAELQALPFNPDLLVIDQITDVAHTLDWKDMAETSRDLQNLAKSWNNEEGLAVVTFGQAKRGTEFNAILTQDDFKYGPAACEWSSAVFYLSQTEEDKENEQLRLGFAKNRDGETPITYARLHPNLEISRIHDVDRETRAGTQDDFPI